MSKSTLTKRVPFAPQPEYTVVWNGATVSPWGERGSLLPPTHNASSTLGPSVDRLRRVVEAANKRDVDG
jgi:hypothetical protein